MQVAPLEERDAVEVVRGPTFVVTHTWPDIRNAEYEVLQRLAFAAQNIGATMITVDNDGRPLWASRRLSFDKNKPIDPAGIDFMISLHFESPKLIDVYSYYALWQPLDFYFQFGYERSIEKLLTHNDGLSCLSDLADAHGKSLFGSRAPLNPAPFPTLFHNCPQPYLEPRITADSRVFYIGVNWERGGQSKGRHAGLFDRLDDENLLDIYGPQKINGFRPWKGFKSYRGELPFDGVSTVRTINQAGICLALSSDSHKRSALMSNRLFEGLAAGAAVIVDSNPFARKHFADVAYFVDESGSAEDVAFQIRAVVDQIRRNPEAAAERVRKGQALLAERFSLEGSLRALIEDHPGRLEHYRTTALAGGTVSVILPYPGQSIDDLLDSIANVARQSLVAVDLVLICDTDLFNQNRAAIETAARGAIRSLRPILRNLGRVERVAGQTPVPPDRTGPAVAEALAVLDTDYFCFLSAEDHWFGDHLASLISAIERHPGASAAASGAIEQKTELSETSRRLRRLHPDISEAELLNARYAGDIGRYLFPARTAEAVPAACLQLLDGQEANLVRLVAALHAPPAETGYASYVRDLSKAERLPQSMILEEHQQQYIRDAMVFDARWLSRMTQSHRLPDRVYAFSRGAPVRFSEFQHPLGVSNHLPLDRLVDTVLDEEGVKYLEHGFSYPENEGVWIEADFGTIEFYCGREAWATAEDRDLVLVMCGRPEHDTDRPQHCTVVLNGVAIAYVEVPEANKEFKLRLPRNAFSDDGRLRVKLIPDHMELVYDSKGKVIDNRRLSIRVRKFGVITSRQPRAVLVADQMYEMREGGEALAVLREGFSYPEANWTWIADGAAQMAFEIAGLGSDAKLRLWMTGRPSGDGSAQTVRISINGAEAEHVELPEDVTELAVPLHPSTADGQVFAIAMSFAHAEPVRGKNNKILDGRLLAAQLIRMQIDAAIPPSPPPSLPLRAKGKVRRLLGKLGLSQA